MIGRSVRDRSGMAALFDALMFLSVMAVVSVAVLVAFTPRSSADGDVQSYVERCQAVLLGTTLHSWSEGSERLMPISDAISSLLLLKKPLPERIHSEIGTILDGLFQPQYRAEWACTSGNSCFVFGEELGTGTNQDSFVSSMTVETPSCLCTYVLTVRYA